MFSVVVAQSRCDDSAIHHVLPVLWMMSFAHNRPGKGDASRACTQSDSAGAELGAKSDVYSCLIWVVCYGRPM